MLIGTGHFVHRREVVLSSEVKKMYYHYWQVHYWCIKKCPLYIYREVIHVVSLIQSVLNLYQRFCCTVGCTVGCICIQLVSAVTVLQIYIMSVSYIISTDAGILHIYSQTSGIKSHVDIIYMLLVCQEKFSLTMIKV